MKVLFLCFVLCLHLPAFSQSDSLFNQYQSSNNKYIVEIHSGVTYVYKVKVNPEFISIYDIDTLGNVLSDSDSGEQLPLFYSNSGFSVEKRGAAYFLVKLNSKQKPKKSLELNPIMERAAIEEGMNDFYLFSFQSSRMSSLSDEFPDYNGYWGETSMTNLMEYIPSDVSRSEYLNQLNRFETQFYDSIRALNIKYTEFIDRVWGDTVSLSEVIAIYEDMKSKDSDFAYYKNHLINDLIDKQPKLFFSLASSMESKEEREELYNSLTRRRYMKLKATEGDADMKVEFRRNHRKNVIINIGIYALETVFTLAATWLLSI